MSKGLVLITGVNGYIAAQAAKHFLDQGYSVRGTVRKRASAQELMDGPLKEYTDAGRFEVVEVPDITIDHAFDNAVKGATAILHLASPVSFSFTDPIPILHAAVAGTKTILHSALDAGPQLQTVVLMSSSAAIVSGNPPPYMHTEKDWNNWAEDMCKEKGTDTPGAVIYIASKAAGEKAFWAFRDEKRPKWSMASINPVFVIGPPLIAPKTASAVGETIHSIYAVFSGAPYPDVGPAGADSVDVRDVAQLLRYAVEHPEETNGERYIASANKNHSQAVADILREELKHDKEAMARIVEGTPGKGYTENGENGGLSMDSRKAKKLLEGGEWIDYRKSVIDTVETFKGLV